jgi:hypothetical protein
MDGVEPNLVTREAQAVQRAREEPQFGLIDFVSDAEGASQKPL